MEIKDAGFESSVNSYGRKTVNRSTSRLLAFESSVNSYGRKTFMVRYCI